MAAGLAPGFADPVVAAQSTFRRIMDATARPGLVCSLAETVNPAPPLARGAGAVALTLFDQDTPVWLDAGLDAEPEVGYWLRFHTRAPIVAEPDRAAFAILSDAERMPDFESFALGTADYPDRSTTLIVQVHSLETGQPLVLAGPGIKGRTTLRVEPLPPEFPERVAANHALFPRGIDMLLVTDGAIVALPRSTTLVKEP